MPDEHVHEVTLPDGQTIRTGPPVSTEEPAAPAAPGTEIPPPQQGMRVTPVLASKVREVNVQDPAQQQQKEGLEAGQALQQRRTEILPAAGQEVFKRMHSSVLKVYTGDGLEEYAQKMAWRAIIQKYGLPWPADLDPPNAAERSTISALAGMQRLPSKARKAYTFGVADRRGGSFIVPCSNNREDALAKYSRVVSVPIPGTPGASVRVGLWSGGRNLIDVTVPSSVVHAQPGEEENNNKAVAWVRDPSNWRTILYVAKHWERPHEKLVQPLQWAWRRQSKLVTDPGRATERMSWGPALVPFEVDLQGQYCTEDEVCKVAWEFLLQNGKIGIMHRKWAMEDGQPPGRAVESFISRPGDPHFPVGAWILGIKWHEQVWPEVEAKRLKGLSVAGAWGAEVIRLFMEATPYEQLAAAA